MVGTYKIADTLIRINSIYNEVHQMCADYAVVSLGADILVNTTEENIRYESEKSDETRVIEGLPPYTFPDSYLETLAVYRQIATAMLKRRTLLFHGSAIAVDGQAYIFTAKSGTGKSTHSRLWRQLFGDRAIMVNDDKPLIKVGTNRLASETGEAKEGEPTMVYGTPWDGKHHLSTNTSVPVKAIIILERGEVNEIHEISPKEAGQILLQQSFEDTDTPEKLIQSLALVNDLSHSVHLYRLHCNMDPDAARVSYEGMNKS